MGQVYRATDTKLKRQVAIKILPPSLAADPDRLARFQREAEVLASLNHPNIARIYGLEEQADRRAVARDGIGRRRGPVAADRPRRDPARRSAADREADCRSARSGARTRHRPPRSEAGQHQSARPTAPSRCSISVSRKRSTRRPDRRRRQRQSMSPTITTPAHDAGRHDSRHRGVHEPGAGAGPGGRQTRRHLGIRLRRVRNAERTARIRRRKTFRSRSRR